MSGITDNQIDAIDSYLKRNGITRTDLRNDLIDHICCGIQEKMCEGKDFNTAFSQIIKSFGNLRSIEIETNKAVIDRNNAAGKILTGLNYGLTGLLLLCALACMTLPCMGVVLYGWKFLSFLPFFIAGLLVCLNGIDYKKLEIKHFGV